MKMNVNRLLVEMILCNIANLDLVKIPTKEQNLLAQKVKDLGKDYNEYS